MTPIRIIVKPKKGNDTSESTRNVGSAKLLSGRIFVLSVFVAPSSDPWKPSDIARQKQKVYEAERWLKMQALRYGKHVEFENCAFGSDGSFCDNSMPRDWDSDDAYFYPSKVLLKMGYRSFDAFIEWVKRNTGCMQCLAVVFSNTYGRSFASPVNKELYHCNPHLFCMECCYIFRGFRPDGRESDAACVAHEMLHLFGAWDLYELDEKDNARAAKTAIMFPKSIMNCKGQTIWDMQIDEITAWLVGLREEGKDWYRWFEPNQNEYLSV